VYKSDGGEGGKTVAQYPTAVWLGRRIQALRTAQGWSVRALAKHAAMPHNNLLKIERGESNIPIETLARVARALGVPLAALFQEGPVRLEVDVVTQTVAHAVTEAQAAGAALVEVTQALARLWGQLCASSSPDNRVLSLVPSGALGLLYTVLPRRGTYAAAYGR
jgi:transcriptional regulator with XRE-family HTH domain